MHPRPHHAAVCSLWGRSRPPSWLSVSHSRTCLALSPSLLSRTDDVAAVQSLGVCVRVCV